MLLVQRCLILLLLSVAAGCTHQNPYFDPAKPHHRLTGFQNNYEPFVKKPLSDLLRWQWDRWRNHLPPAVRTPAVVQTPDLNFIQRNATGGAAMQPAITWIGHASVLIQMAGLNIITDPHFSLRASPVQFAGPTRAQPPGIALNNLPHIDAVLISHNHYDHLDDGSVRALSRQSGGSPLFIVPLGLKAWFNAREISNVVELDWWQAHRLEAAEIVLTPVQHWSSRSLTDAMETLWGGYAVFAPDFQFYFSGDTGYSKDFADARARFAARQTPAQGGGFDVALLAIGAYEPRWFMRPQHVNPAAAVQVHRDLGAKLSVGIHWGTFAMTDEPLDEPPRALARARAAQHVADERFITMAIGETRVFQRRAPLAAP